MAAKNARNSAANCPAPPALHPHLEQIDIIQLVNLDQLVNAAHGHSVKPYRLLGAVRGGGFIREQAALLVALGAARKLDKAVVVIADSRQHQVPA